MKKTLWIWVVVVVVILLCGTSGYFIWAKKNNATKTNVATTAISSTQVNSSSLVNQTYKDANISFQYPNNWVAGNVHSSCGDAWGGASCFGLGTSDVMKTNNPFVNIYEFKIISTPKAFCQQYNNEQIFSNCTESNIQNYSAVITTTPAGTLPIETEDIVAANGTLVLIQGDEKYQSEINEILQSIKILTSITSANQNAGSAITAGGLKLILPSDWKLISQSIDSRYPQNYIDIGVPYPTVTTVNANGITFNFSVEHEDASNADTSGRFSKLVSNSNGVSVYDDSFGMLYDLGINGLYYHVSGDDSVANNNSIKSEFISMLENATVDSTQTTQQQILAAAGWKTYTSNMGDYFFQYPANATISSDNSGSNSPACVAVNIGTAVDEGWVKLNNGDENVPCEPTGVGVNEKPATDNVVFSGQSQTVKGWFDASDNNGWFVAGINNVIGAAYGVDSNSPISKTNYNYYLNIDHVILNSIQLTAK